MVVKGEDRLKKIVLLLVLTFSLCACGRLPEKDETTGSVEQAGESSSSSETAEVVETTVSSPEPEISFDADYRKAYFYKNKTTEIISIRPCCCVDRMRTHCCSFPKSCPVFATPWTVSFPGFPVLHHLCSLLKLMY